MVVCDTWLQACQLALFTRMGEEWMLHDRTNLRQKMAATAVEALSYRRHINPVVRHFAIIPHVGRQGSRSKRHDAAQHALKLVLHTNSCLLPFISRFAVAGSA